MINTLCSRLWKPHGGERIVSSADDSGTTIHIPKNEVRPLRI